MHIVSASRRTDIPAFHSEWFMNRIHEGAVGVVSPFGAGAHRVSLASEDVIAIVFWTKNAAPILPHLESLVTSKYSFTFLYTINNYPLFLEPKVPDKNQTLKTVEALVTKYSNSVFRWRYDTIVLTDTLTRKWHVENFTHLCEALSPWTTECIFSFCDYYRKTTRNMQQKLPDHHRPDDSECIEMSRELAEIAEGFGISLSSCAHDLLVGDGVKKARCIDPMFLDGVVDTDGKRSALKALKLSPTRKNCGCVASKDIGAYNTCAHGCVYCYANSNEAAVLRNMANSCPDVFSLDPKWCHDNENRHGCHGTKASRAGLCLTKAGI